METHVHIFRSTPHRGSSMSGSHGSESWEGINPDNPYPPEGPSPMGGPSIQKMVGRFLHEGSVVKVTVEVVSEEDDGPRNPFYRERRK